MRKRARSSRKAFARTQGELAGIFGVSRVTILDWVQRGAPKKTRKGWDVEAMRTWREQNMRPARWTGATARAAEATAPPLPNGDAALFLGSDSPALERFRMARAEQVEIELAIQKKNLVAREELHEWLIKLSSILRSAGDTLQRQYGPDAMRIMEEALDEYDRLLKEYLGDPGSGKNGSS